MEMLAEDIAIKKYDAYKDSGVEWLGQIPEHWECVKMKYLFRDTTIKNKPNEELLSVTQDKGVIPRTWVENRMVMPSGNLESFKFIQKGDFAISLRSFEGGLEFCHHDGIISPAYTVLKAIKDFDVGYFKYLFKCHSFISELQTSIVGIRQGKNISFEELGYSFLPIPPSVERRVIVDFLNRKIFQIDKAIAQKEKLIELLNERKAISIHNAVTCGLDREVEMKKCGINGIAEVPINWHVKRLKFILKAQGRIGFKGYTTSDLVEPNQGALTLGASHFNWDGNFDLSEPVYISWKKYYESPEIMVNRNDILIVQRGSTCGKVAFVNDNFGPTTINPSLVLLKQIKETPEYVFLAIKIVLNTILNEVSNTAIPMLSQEQINNIVIPIPPRKEQYSISTYAYQIAKRIDAAVLTKQKEIEKLKEYKATLINAVVTGKIKVC